MATFFTWDEGQYSVWVKSMDDEHKKLIEIMNRLHARNEANAPKNELVSIVKELGEYTVKHFSDEEQFMASVKFSGIETHKIIHKDLLTKFSSHKDKFVNGSEVRLGADFFMFLKTWLAAHIQGIDRKYGAEATKKAA